MKTTRRTGTASALGLCLLFVVAAGCGESGNETVATNETGTAVIVEPRGDANRVGQVAMGGDPNAVSAGAEGTGPEGGFGLARWFDGELGPTDSQIRLRFYARDASGGELCEEWIRPEVSSEEHRLRLLLMAYVADNTRWAGATAEERANCQRTVQRLTVDVGEPLGDRLLVQVGGDTEMRIEGGELRVVPESRPCGRIDCNTTSPDPAACDREAQRQAVDQIDGGSFGAGESRCDGSFLVLGGEVGAGGCLADETGDNPCGRSKRAFFVA